MKKTEVPPPPPGGGISLLFRESVESARRQQQAAGPEETFRFGSAVLKSMTFNIGITKASVLIKKSALGLSKLSFLTGKI